MFFVKLSSRMPVDTPDQRQVAVAEMVRLKISAARIFDEEDQDAGYLHRDGEIHEDIP